MFYVLSKALLFLIQPASWLVILVIVALMAKRKRVKRRALWIAAILYLVLGNPVLYSTVMGELEWPVQHVEGEHYRYAIILGGYGEYNYGHEGLEFNKAADRLIAAIELYNSGVVEVILLSSGVHPNDLPELTEAMNSKKLLLAAGIPETDILIEGTSWNTHENAVYTAELIQKQGGARSCLLVTSAFHMNRALRCFQNEGLDPSPYPVDYISGGQVCMGLGCLLPSMRVLMDWQIVIKEKVGMVVYGVRGWV